MTKYGIGQPVLRVEDRRFITGHGQFVDDVNLPHQSYGVVLMSPHAHARIHKINTAKAKASVGVLDVLTGADVNADQLGGLPPLFMPDDHNDADSYQTLRPLLITDRVRCVGDRIAFVVAETLALALDAAELVEVDYETLLR